MRGFGGARGKKQRLVSEGFWVVGQSGGGLD